MGTGQRINIYPARLCFCCRTDRGMLDAALLSACRSLVALQVPGRYYEQALKYKGDCI